MRSRILFLSMICFVVLTQSITSAQINRDSLLKIWKNPTIHDTLRAQAMYEITWYYMYKDTDSARMYVKEQLNYGMKNHSYYSQSYALNVYGLLMITSGKPDSALYWFNRLLTLEKKHRSKSGIAAVYANMSIVYKQRGDYTSAIKYIEKARVLHERIGDERGAIGDLANIAGCHRLLGSGDVALNYYLECVKRLKNPKHIDLLPQVFNNIGMIYIDRKDYDEADKWMSRSLEYNIKLNRRSIVAVNYTNLGDIRTKQGRYAEALSYFHKGLKIREELNEVNVIPGTLCSMAEVYLLKYDSSVKTARPFIEFLRTAGELIGRAEPYILQYGTYTAQHEFYEVKWKYSKVKKDYGAALKAYEKFIEISDSMAHEQNTKALISHQFKFEYEKKSAADSVKRAEEKKISVLKLKQERSQRYFLYAGLALTIVFGLFMYSRFRLIKRQKILIEEQKAVVEQQKLLVEEKNKEVIESITYARRIQSAIMPSYRQLDRLFKRSDKKRD